MAPATHTARALMSWRSADRRWKFQLVVQRQSAGGSKDRIIGLRATMQF
jgi:hypothetical protein